MCSTDQIKATPERLEQALRHGGSATVTLRSLKTGEHVTVSYAVKKRAEGGGYISRAKTVGRVGIGEGDVIFMDDPTLAWPDGKVGSLSLESGEWRTAKGADPARMWAAQHAFAWAMGKYPALTEQADVYMALSCSYCKKRLTDPVSVERGVGPDCWGKHTGSKSVKREKVEVGS